MSAEFSVWTWYCPVCKKCQPKANNERPNTQTDRPPLRGDCPDCGTEMEVR